MTEINENGTFEADEKRKRMMHAVAGCDIIKLIQKNRRGDFLFLNGMMLKWFGCRRGYV